MGCSCLFLKQLFLPVPVVTQELEVHVLCYHSWQYNKVGVFEEFLSLVSKSRTYTSLSVKSLCISFLSHIFYLFIYLNYFKIIFKLLFFVFFLSKCDFPVKGYQGKIAPRSRINCSGYFKQLRLEISKMRLNQIGLKALSVSSAGTKSSCQGQHHIPSASPGLKHWLNCFKNSCDTLKFKFN